MCGRLLGSSLTQRHVLDTSESDHETDTKPILKPTSHPSDSDDSDDSDVSDDSDDSDVSDKYPEEYLDTGSSDTESEIQHYTLRDSLHDVTARERWISNMCKVAGFDFGFSQTTVETGLRVLFSSGAQMLLLRGLTNIVGVEHCFTNIADHLDDNGYRSYSFFEGKHGFMISLHQGRKISLLKSLRFRDKSTGLSGIGFRMQVEKSCSTLNVGVYFMDEEEAKVTNKEFQAHLTKKVFPKSEVIFGCMKNARISKCIVYRD